MSFTVEASDYVAEARVKWSDGIPKRTAGYPARVTGKENTHQFGLPVLPFELMNGADILSSLCLLKCSVRVPSGNRVSVRAQLLFLWQSNMLM